MTRDDASPAFVRRQFLGVGLHDVTMDEAIAMSLHAIRARVPIQIHQVNVHNLLQARRDRSLRGIYESAELVGVDGKGIWFGARLLGEPFRGTITGVALMERLLELAARQKLSVYLLGATPEIVATAARRVELLHPAARVAGFQHGYWKQNEEADVVAAVARSGADILFVGMSTPLKERFLQRYYTQMNVPVCVSVGGSLDVLAGATKRAPRWMQAAGLEWCFRLMQEPRRMWRRYLLGLPKFGALLAIELPQRMLRGRFGSQPGARKE